MERLWFQFPFCSFFPSAALVSVLFLPHVLNAPEERDEPLCGGRVGGGTGGYCQEGCLPSLASQPDF